MHSVLIHAKVWRAIQRQRPDGDDGIWDGLDQKALAMITLSVKQTQLGYLKSCTPAGSAWQKMKDVHQPSGSVRKVSLYKKLVGMRMAEDDEIAVRINSFCSTVDKISEVDIKLGDELTAII